MGLIRKSLAIGSLGVVNGSSKKQRVARATLRAAQAEAEATLRLSGPDPIAAARAELKRQLSEASAVVWRERGAAMRAKRHKAFSEQAEHTEMKIFFQEECKRIKEALRNLPQD